MRSGKRIACALLIVFLAAAMMVEEAAAKLSIQLTLEREVMRVGEQNKLTVEITSDKGVPPNPQLPQVDGLNFYSLGGGSQSQNIQWDSVTGRMVSEFKRTLMFVVVPAREGTFKIGGVSVRQGAETVVADPVQLTVLRAGAPTPTPSRRQGADWTQQPLQSGDVRLIVELGKTAAYVGEAVPVRYVLIGAPNLIQQISSFGNLGTGLFKRCVVEEVDLGELHLQRRNIGGRILDAVVLRHFILFPLSAGPIDVDPVTLGVDVRTVSRRRSILDFPFGRTERRTISSRPLRIEVVPLPTEGRPDDFDGAVGDFQLEATVDKQELVEGDALSVKIVLAGAGNIRNSPPPTLPDLSGFDQYESTKKEDVSLTAQGVSGRITYEYVLIPKDPSSTQIGPVSLSFFNPEDAQYRTISTKSIQLVIKPRTQGPGDRVLLAAGAGAKREIVLTGEDFRHIAVGVAGANRKPLDLYRQPVYIGLMVTPFLLVAGVAVYARHRRRLETDPEYARHRRAPRIARRMLSEARQAVSAGDRQGAYVALSKTLVDYVGDRWNLAPTGMTTRDLGSHLRDRGVPEHCVGDLVATLEDFEACRFGGNADSNLRSDLQHTEQVLSSLMALEKEGK